MKSKRSRKKAPRIIYGLVYMSASIALMIVLALYFRRHGEFAYYVTCLALSFLVIIFCAFYMRETLLNPPLIQGRKYRLIGYFPEEKRACLKPLSGTGKEMPAKIFPVRFTRPPESGDVGKIYRAILIYGDGRMSLCKSNDRYDD